MTQLNFSKLITLLSIIVLGGVMFDDAFAYIDPGSGTLFIQVIIGVLVGAGITIKIYWLRIRMKLSSIGKNDD